MYIAILLIFIPGAGLYSNIVITGPGRISVILPDTPKSFSLSSQIQSDLQPQVAIHQIVHYLFLTRIWLVPQMGVRFHRKVLHFFENCLPF